MPTVYHVIAAAFVALCAWTATRHHELYRAAMQEDRGIEWMTAFAFAAAGVLLLRRAVRERRAFDGLVALFLLFVAGEEVSWAQRLLGLMPPAYFLEHNAQQEMNLHNFASFAGSPKGPFSMILIGYAVVMPLVGLVARGRRVLDTIGATAPPASIIPWFLASVLLLFWYPFSFTGEWVELLAGSAFLIATGASHRQLGALFSVAVVFGIGMSAWSARGIRGTRDAATVACANAEAIAIAEAVRGGSFSARSTHKRVWTLVAEDAVDGAAIRQALEAVRCASKDSEERRRFAVDPWGTAYWIRARPESNATAISVYSFGPNRRRDADTSGGQRGDDIFTGTRP
jgi:hypothetical protein